MDFQVIASAACAVAFAYLIGLIKNADKEDDETTDRTDPSQPRDTEPPQLSHHASVPRSRDDAP